MQNLYHDLEAALQQDQAFISDGKILKNVVIEKALQLDPALLSILLGNDGLRKHFFQEVAGAVVFDKVKFQQFVSNKAFLPDSFTAFKNKIGLVSGQEYLKEANDVVLAWPYKDCVLEGGQTREDRGRKEIFWNETLAPDHINRLFEPKVLVNCELWDADAVQAGLPKSVADLEGVENLLIKGNNLLALHSLKKKFAGQVKVVYIDPPYNTEEDSFQYNDKFNHSTWLTFLRNRAEVARDFLKTDGLFFVNISDVEMHYAKIVLDEVFGRGNFIATIPRKTRSGKSDVPYKLSQDFDWVLAYTKGASRSSELFQRTVSRRYHLTGDFPNDPWRTTDLTTQRTTAERPNSDFTMVNPKNGESYPVNPERCWSVSEDTYPGFLKKKKIVFPGDYDFLDISGPVMRVFQSEEKEKKGDDFDKSYVSSAFLNLIMEDLLKKSSNKAGTDEIQALFGSKKFAYPKPEKLIKAILEYTTEVGDIVLDFHAGSGTTAAVAHKMGRRWISIEQMDYIKELTTERLKKVIGGETGGVSGEVKWSGGGSFLYAELCEKNATLVRLVMEADDTETKAIASKLRMTGYVRPGIKLDELSSDEFSALELGQQKQILMDCLDANHFYVNYGDIDDADYGISEEDKALNRSFYEGGNK